MHLPPVHKQDALKGADMRVRGLTIPSPSCVSPNDNVQVAAREMKVHELGVLPVCAEGVLIGVITDRDIGVECMLSGNPIGCLVRDYMTRDRVEMTRTTGRDDDFRSASGPYGITRRERAVLQLVVDGKADKEIAGALGITIYTANKHVSSILSKMNAASRTEAGVRAIKEGLLVPELRDVKENDGFRCLRKGRRGTCLAIR
jgi:DNA-binding CsgD family transcriptional regulator